MSSLPAPTGRRSRRRAVGLLAVGMASTLGLGALTASPALAELPPELTQDLVVHYPLDETSGTTVSDASGNDRDASIVDDPTGRATWNAGLGLTLPGGAGTATTRHPSVQLPSGLLAGLTEVTVAYDVRPTSNQSQLFTFGTTPDASGVFSATTASPRGATITYPAGGVAAATASGAVTTNAWRHVTITFRGGTIAAPGQLVVYENGVQVAANNNVTIEPQAIAALNSFIGRPSNTAGNANYFAGTVKDFRVYSKVLNADQALALAQETGRVNIAQILSGVDLGDTSQVTGKIMLPAVAGMTWSSSNPAVVSPTGEVTRPLAGQGDATVTLTAQLTYRGLTETKQFEVTVLAEPEDGEKVRVDCAAAIQSDVTDVRGNLELPTTGREWGSTIVWQTSAPEVVSTSGIVARPAHGEQAEEVRLTATATLNDEAETCHYDLTVTPLPENDPYERYLFASFHGGDDGGRNGEQIWISASKDNDPFNWYEVNYDEGTAVSQPILQTVNPPQGQMGLRDPSLMRSPDGDRFYLLATDLKTYQDGQSWSYRQSKGSRDLVVYESDDLVNWSEPRFVKVEDDSAGNVWAPEAFWDEKTGQYIVFWASNLYPSTDIANRNTSQISYNRIRVATTRDFVTFSEPTTWINLDRSTNQNGWGMIDSTMIATDDRIYRLTKDENGFRVLLQYIDSLDDLYDTWGAPETEPHVTNRNPITPLTTDPNAWTMVGNPDGSSKWQVPGLNGGNLEGPLVFKDNVDEMYYVFIDYASGGGYVAWRSPSMDRPPSEWEYLGQSWCNTTGLSSNCSAQSATSPYWSLPVSPRHGSVLPITLEEWERVMSHYNSPVHAEASIVTADGTPVEDGAWVNEAPEVEVTWTDFNGTDLAPAWVRLIEGHNGGNRVVGEKVDSGIEQGMTIPVTTVEGVNWAQVEYRDASLGGDAVMLWTTEVEYRLDTTSPVITAEADGRELSIDASDPAPANGAENSGLASCEFRIGDAAAEDCEATVTLPASIGDRTVTIVAADHAGNETTETVLVEGRGVDVTATVATRCVAGKVTQVVTLTNGEDVPVSTTIRSAYGSKTTAALAPGKSVSHAFSTRLGTIPSGSVTIEISATIDGESVELEKVAQHSPAFCG